MVPALIRLGVVFISWTSFVFLPKRSFNRYLPVSIFTSVLVLMICALSIPYKFWVIRGNKTTRLLNDLSFVFGPFFAGTLWVFHLTFGKFKKYVGLNLIMNALLSFPLSYLFQKLKVYKLVNFKSTYVFLTYFGFSFIIYRYQLLLEKCFPYHKRSK